MTRKSILRLAAKIADKYLTRYEQYEADCAAYAAEGYRPRYCEHGTSNWTDYDNICGACEDGWTMGDGVMRRRMALDSAIERYRQIEELLTAAESVKSIVGSEAIDMDQVWNRITVLGTP